MSWIILTISSGDRGHDQLFERGNVVDLWKGLRRRWKEKVANEKQKYLYAGHGSAWKNREDTHA